MTDYERERKFVLLEMQGEEEVVTLEEGFHSRFSGIGDFVRQVMGDGKDIRQAYIGREHWERFLDLTGVEVPSLDVVDVARVRQYGSQFIATMKGPGLEKKLEKEAEISEEVFHTFLPFAEGNPIPKRRLSWTEGVLTFDCDIFYDHTLFIAEIEMPEDFDGSKVPIMGRDVTGDPAYTNSEIAKRPISTYRVLSRSAHASR